MNIEASCDIISSFLKFSFIRLIIKTTKNVIIIVIDKTFLEFRYFVTGIPKSLLDFTSSIKNTIIISININLDRSRNIIPPSLVISNLNNLNLSEDFEIIPVGNESKD